MEHYKKDTIFNDKWVISIIFLLIIIFSCILRVNTFWLPHMAGDQSHYITLALKLEEYGMSQYNLRSVRFRTLDVGPDNKIKIGYLLPLSDVNDKGDVLLVLNGWGVKYYDQPFFHKPPGLPWMLMLSHKLFADKDQPYMMAVTNMGEAVKDIKLNQIFESQFYAAIVPFVFSVGVVLCTFFLGKIYGSNRTGVYASLMMGINPIALMTSSKILADDMLTFFVVLSALLCMLSIKKNKKILMLFAGIACGIGVMAKQSAGYFMIAFGVFMAMYNYSKIKDIRSLIKAIFSHEILLFSLGVLIVSGWWFVKVYNVYGNPLWLPQSPDEWPDSGWFNMLMSRPKGWMLYPVGIPFLCPLFILAYASLKKFVSNTINLFKKNEYDYKPIFMWIAILVFYIFFIKDYEHRYMMPVYPFIAVLSASVLDDVREYKGRFSRFFGRAIYRDIFIFGIFVVCALWCVHIGMDAVFNDRFLILKPF